jgi:lysophospholipase L1-like esterase
MTRVQCIIPALKSNNIIRMAYNGLVASLLGALVVACSACGGGGGSSPSPVQQQIQAPSKQLLIEAYGDSTMWGAAEVNNVYVQVAQPAPAELQSLLRAKYGDGVTVTNYGVSGTTATDLLQGGVSGAPWNERMAKSKADIVYFNFGINDANPANGESVTQFINTETALAQIAIAAGKQVIIETSNPVGDTDFAALPNYVAATASVAQSLSLPLIDEYGYMAQLDWMSLMSDPQKMHPNQTGYEVKARFEFNTFDPIVGTLLKR